nr:hypothetical protein [Tanacetum cinerariifolium]
FKSEVELQLGKKIKALRSLKVWGCEAYVKRDSADKLHQRSVKYGNFFKRDLISQKFSVRDIDLEDDHMDTLPSENTSEIPLELESLGSPPELIPVRRSERTTRAPNRLCLNIEVEDDEVGDLGEHANYKAAMLDPDMVIWQGAMDEEMNSMKVMKVWIAVNLSPNAKVVRSKWPYKKKPDMDGKVHTYKAHLVAKGCTQTYVIDHEETFSPVADIRAIRILIAIAAYYDYEIWQIDVKTASLNGRLDEDIYMEQPKGYVDPKYPNRVCKLQRSIYGLKQASRQWNKRFDEEIKNNELCASTPENVAYMKKVPYASGVGSIMYAVRCTRPDVAVAQNFVSRYQQNPGKLYWVAVKHILKYLRHTRDMFLVYEGNQIQNLMLQVSVMRPGNVIKMIRSLRRVMSLSSMEEQ